MNIIRYIKTIRNNKYLKKFSISLMLLLLLTILSIILLLIINKYTIENLEGEIDKSKSKMEVSLVTSQIKKHKEHPFVRPTGDWDAIVNKYKGNPRITIRIVDINNISTITDTKYFNFKHSDYPMVISSVFINDKRYSIGFITHEKLSYEKIETLIELVIKHFF